MNDSDLKALILSNNPEVWDGLLSRTRLARGFDELFRLSSLRKKAHQRQISRPGLFQEKLRLAMVGGYNFYPFHDLLGHICEMEGFPCDLWLGSYDNYVSEIMEEDGELYKFAPKVILLIPPEHRCRYPGKLTDSREVQQSEAKHFVTSLLDLAHRAHQKSNAEIIITNFMLPARHDLGAYRARTLGSDWSFRKWVNLELGLNAPPFVQICDIEFLSYRHGGMSARDERAWFESKQPGAPDFLAEFAREASHLILSLRQPQKKVLVLDLDNTLWGGVVADDGLEGIEIGDTSPRGEAFKAFQKYIVSLKARGILLAVASKNDHDKASEVFQKHSEMLLGMDDFVAFKANWEPKSDNIRRIASELNLGLDSFVFVDDNPAEIEIVRQFAPEVTTLLLGPDPSEYVSQLQDCRFFEPRSITTEDFERTEQYQSEAQRQALSATITDMGSYLESLAMEGEFSDFTPLDIPRLAQLINKSNQFNLTTRRRTEAELHALMQDPDYSCLSFRLKDRFGDHGLISILIAKQSANTLIIDTWLMSCRVLKRQVEDEVLNELIRVAQNRNCKKIEGTYLPTSKNEMVRDFYLRMGFTLMTENEKVREFELNSNSFQTKPTKIKITRRIYESS